ncbi:MAG: hypothetical protein ACLPZM_04060 [Thermoplasmata archaeon]
MVLHGLGFLPLLIVPAVAVGSDLIFQVARFPRPRFPDAALATGLLIAVILPPVVPLTLAGAVAFAAIGIRHAIRYRGHPFFNPAASGVFLGALVFGLAPAWWVSLGQYGEFIMVGLGLLLLARSPRSWRLPLGFFVAYGLTVAAVHLLISASLNPNVLFLEVADPATIFFGLYMITEPRTSPADPAFQALYGAGAAIGAVTLSLVFPSIGILIGLLIVNIVVGGLRVVSSAPVARPVRHPRVTPKGTLSDSPARWPVAYRASAVFFVLVVVLATIAISPNANPQPITITTPGGGGGGHGGGPPLTSCAHDNPAIPASTLSSLHQLLGPSVILSDNPNNGVVVFYDPVNHVTVTESDLYEDFGYAEFNGDDYAVSGCHP